MGPLAAHELMQALPSGCDEPGAPQQTCPDPQSPPKHLTASAAAQVDEHETFGAIPAAVRTAQHTWGLTQCSCAHGPLAPPSPAPLPPLLVLPASAPWFPLLLPLLLVVPLLLPVLLPLLPVLPDPPLLLPAPPLPPLLPAPSPVPASLLDVVPLSPQAAPTAALTDKKRKAPIHFIFSRYVTALRVASVSSALRDISMLAPSRDDRQSLVGS
jgi:hypothetical protein